MTAPKAAAGSLALTQSYSYDALNRLASVSEDGVPSFNEQFSFDRYGNQWVSASSGLTLNQQTPRAVTSFDQMTNRLSAVVLTNVLYDGAGNLTRDVAGNQFTYDGENRQLTSSVGGVTASYSYDGDGRRVKKIVGNTTTVMVYNAAGQLIAEYTSDPVPPVAGGGGTSYLTTDGLGSPRVVTNASGAVKARHDFLPYGEEIVSSIGGRSAVTGYAAADSTRQKFTSKERDSESGLDYFLARYYSSAQGRFTSPDEYTGGPDELFIFAEDAADNPTFYADIYNPQSLNKYQYCLNNPLRYVDPDGHQDIASTTLKVGARTATRSSAGPLGWVILGIEAYIYVDSHSDTRDATADDCAACGRYIQNHVNRKQVEQNAQGEDSTWQTRNGSAAHEQERSNDEKLDKRIGPKAKDAPGVSAGGQGTDKHGNKLVFHRIRFDGLKTRFWAMICCS